MRRTEFKKAYRINDYWLRWTDTAGLRCEAFLCTMFGNPLLAVEKHEFDGARFSRVVHNLETQAMLERGMLEQITPASERGHEAPL